MQQLTLDRVFIDYSVRKLRQQAARVQDCLAKLDDRQVWRRGADSENAIGNLVLHLCGNVRQWVVSGIGGARDARERDGEFQARGEVPVSELSSRLQETVDEAIHVLAGLTAERLLTRVTVQGYDVTVMECTYHVVEHFCGHAGQIIFATKANTHADLGYHGHPGTAAPHDQRTP